MPKVEVPIAPIDEIPNTGSKLADFFGRTLHVVRDEQGSPAIYMNVCTNFGGTLACVDGEFRCEWHGATFDARTGRRTGGLAPNGTQLMRMPAVERNGTLFSVFEWGATQDADLAAG